MSGPVFVVGCPRSGTSPFARWLAECGLPGPDDDRRREGYPAGYYEHLPILMFHKALERLPRGAEHAIRLEPYLHAGQLEDPFVASAFRQAFEPVRRGEFGFVKFPQLALSIDFLFEQFPGCHVIGLWRDPAAAFRSLVLREFPAEMRPASGLRAVLLWNLYAYHLVRAAEKRPDDVTLVEIDGFFADPELPSRLLARMGHPELAPRPVAEVVDLSRWSARTPWRWRLYHRAMVAAARVAARRMGERAVLASQAEWRRRLAAASVSA